MIMDGRKKRACMEVHVPADKLKLDVYYYYYSSSWLVGSASLHVAMDFLQLHYLTAAAMETVFFVF